MVGDTKRGSGPCFEVRVADVLIGVHQLMGNCNCITPFICRTTDFEPSAAQVASGESLSGDFLRLCDVSLDRWAPGLLSQRINHYPNNNIPATTLH